MPDLHAQPRRRLLTALREANQAGNLQPTTLVSYEADIELVFDARDEKALRAYRMDGADLADPTWRDRISAEGEAKTQGFARALAGEGAP